MNPNEFRKTIPLLQRHPDIIYLDSATTTLIPQEVIQEINHFYENIGVIPKQASYDLALKSNKILNDTRNLVGDFFSVNPERIAFTSGSAHGSATAISLSNLRKGDRMLLAANLHNSVLLNCFRYAKYFDIGHSFINLDRNGQINLNELEEKIRHNKRNIIVLDHLPVGWGDKLNIKAVSELVHKFENCYLFLDATRSAGLIELEVERLNIDYLVCQANVGLYGPSGVGILISPDEIVGEPVYLGAGTISDFSRSSYSLASYPTNIEPDSINIGGIAGLNIGIQTVLRIGISRLNSYSRDLLKYLILGLKNRDDVIIYGQQNASNRLNILGLNINNMSPYDLDFLLQEIGNIFVRSGQLCSHNSLRKTGSMVQLSVNYYNIKEDIEKFLDTLNQLK